METYLNIHPYYLILICSICRSAVRPGDAITTHFRQHHYLKGLILKDLLFSYGDLQLNDPITIVLPPDNSPPLIELPILCRFLTTSHDAIRKHFRAVQHSPCETPWLPVQLQTWLNGRYARYWIVSDIASPSKASSLSTNKLSLQNCIIQQEAAFHIIDQQSIRTGDTREGLERDSSWVLRLGWVQHFASRDKLSISQIATWDSKVYCTVPNLGSDPVRIHSQSQLLASSFVREAKRCLLRLPSVPIETRQWLSSISSIQPSPRPFGILGQDQTFVRYITLGQRYLIFCLRAYHYGQAKAYEDWAISFTPTQWSLLCDIVTYLTLVQENPDQTDTILPVAPGSYEPWTFDPDDNLSTRSSSPYPSTSYASAPKLNQLDRTVFSFFLASVQQQIGGNLYLNPLLCFCAALGIRTNPIGYIEPHLYTTKLAGLLWLVRLFSLEYTFQDLPYELATVSTEAIKVFQNFHSQWLVTGTYTPCSTIIGWMAYGRGWRNQMPGQGSVRWSEDKEILFHTGEAIPVREFQQTACRFIEYARQALDKIFSVRWAILCTKIDLVRIHDHPVRIGAGQSFATDVRNQWLRPGARTVLDHIGPSLWDSVRGQWKRKAVRTWLQQLRLFKELLLVLVHIWGGQPGRGPEVITLRYADSWQLVRNIFILDGEVMLYTDRDKGKVLYGGKGRQVARFLPYEIGQILVGYIIWLLPTERLLRTQCGMQAVSGEQLEYLWCEKETGIWSSTVISSILVRLLQPELGIRIGIARYREIAIEMGRRIRGLTTQQAELNIGQDNDTYEGEVDPLTGEPYEGGQGSWNIVWDLQATHSTKVARQHYAVHVGFSGGLQPEMIATFRTVSLLWHQFLYSSTEMENSKKRKASISYSDIEEQAGAAVYRNKAEQRTKRVTDAQLLDGLRTMFGSNARWKSAEQASLCRTILSLQKDQTLVSILPTGSGKSILFFLPAVVQSTRVNIVIVPFIALVDDLLVRGRTMGVDCIRYESGLRTGREGQVRAAQVVLISADIACTDEFYSYVDGLVAAELLARIFMDECHTILTDSGYRVRLQELKGVRRFRQPVIYLTATLPPTFLPWFRTEVLAEDVQVVRVPSRKANHRYSVRVIARRKGVAKGDKRGETVESYTVEIVRRLGEKMVGQQKGIVYCRTKREAEKLAELIGCSFYHSGLCEQEQVAVRTEWMDGFQGQRWIIATVGLGTGVDIGGIVAVVHMGLPYGLIDFVQQVGRGGRQEGEVVDSVIVYDGGKDVRRLMQARTKVEEMNIEEMEAYVSTSGCRRTVLGRFLDGSTGDYCGTISGAIPCDRCMKQEDDSRSRGVKGKGIADLGRRVVGRGEKGATVADLGDVRGRLDKEESVWKVYKRTQGQRRTMLLRWLDKVEEEDCNILCGLLRTQEYARTGEERLRKCVGKAEQPYEVGGQWCRTVRTLTKKQWFRTYEKEKRGVRFEELSCCFKCKLPLDWCLERRTGESGDCTKQDRVLPVVLTIVQETEKRKIVQERFGIDCLERTRYLQWLGRGQEFYGVRGTNALLVLEEIIWEIYKGKKGEEK